MNRVRNRKSPRKKIPVHVEQAVLAKSGRRCTLCFGIDGDLTERRGQIAHLDADRTNIAESNLAWMCLDHHSLFDSKTSQHKNYTIAEVRSYRQKLYNLIARGNHLAKNNTPSILHRSAFAVFEKVGALKSCAVDADGLAEFLERIWHQFHQEKKVLMYPLGKNVIPDEIKEWTDKLLWRFRVLYQSHLELVNRVDSEFHSDVINDGFPCDGQDYLTVKKKIEEHSALLKDRAQLLLRPSVR